MSAFLFLMLMMLAARQGGGALTSSTPLAAQAAHAQIEATVKQTQAKTDPSKRAEAAKAQKKADDLTKAAQQQAKAKAAPAPWPQAMPAGLPPFPAGWEFDAPPPQAVQTRAWQLLPQLWKTGAGSRKTEQTAGRWITYQAQLMKAGKKGVVAFRVKPGAMPAPRNVA